MVKSYRSIEITIPPETENYEVIDSGLEPSFHCGRWIVINDSSHNSIFVKINSLDNSTITIKAGEYFGEDQSTTQIYLSNLALEPIGVRIRLGAVDALTLVD